MIVKNMGENFYIRIDRGEEIVTFLQEFCETHDVRSGLISGLGSVTKAELGLYDLEKKEFLKKEFEGIFEIASMNGNISRMDGKPYLHIHAVLSDAGCRTYGGHFAMGVVGATCEIVVTPFEYKADRQFSEEIGLNLLDI
jgi:predicted DNA-binding protein with PD1-like motif